MTLPNSNSPANIVRGFYDALNRGDAPAALALLNEDLEWTEAERFPYYDGRTWRSPAEVLNNLLIPITRDWDNFSPTIDECLGEGDRVVSLGRYVATFKKTGKAMNAPFAHTWSVHNDNGRITKFNMCVDSAQVLEAMR